MNYWRQGLLRRGLNAGSLAPAAEVLGWEGRADGVGPGSTPSTSGLSGLRKYLPSHLLTAFIL